MNKTRLFAATLIVALCSALPSSPTYAGRTANVNYAGWKINDDAQTARVKLCNTIDPSTGQPQITGRARVTMGCPDT